MIRFEHSWLLWLLLLMPVVTAVLFQLLRQRRRYASRFVDEQVLNRVAYSLSAGRLRIKVWLWVIALALLIIGAANPQVGTKLEEVKREGIDVIVALDVSASMLCEDLSPSRLDNAKHELLKFISGLKGDRIGLVAFAGTAVTHCPLTMDYGAAKLLVRVMSPDLVPEPGTALADAIESAKRSFESSATSESRSRVLVILTDGEDHEGEAVEAAAAAAEAGIRIYTIGLGTPQGAPIPVVDQKGKRIGFKEDRSGNVVVTRLNEVLLQQVAQAGGGRYLRGTQSARELEAIWEDIAAMEKQEFGKKQFTAFEDRFQYAVFPALLLLIGEFLVSERRGPIWFLRPGRLANRLRWRKS